MSASIIGRGGPQYDGPVADVRVRVRHDRSDPRAPLHEPGAAHYEPGMRCVVTTADRGGRLADRSLLLHLGWHPGTGVRFDIWGDLIVVVTDVGGATSVTAQGCLRLPLAVRRRCRIDSGTRVLAMAKRDTGSVVVATMASVEDMVVDRLARSRR